VISLLIIYLRTLPVCTAVQYNIGISCSWDRASLDMNIIYVTNKMQFLTLSIDSSTLHVSGVSRPSSGAQERCVQPIVPVCWSM